MATGSQVEELTGYLANQTPAADRQNVLIGLQRLGTGLAGLDTVKTLLDTVVTDAAAAGQDEYALEAVQADWASNLAAIITASFSYSGKTSINALAQVIADLSEQAGLEGGANRLRLFKGPPASETVIAVDQDA